MFNELLLIPAVAMGLLISILEIIFVRQDERGMHWLTHGLHAVPTCVIFTLIAMNVPVVIEYLNIAFLQGTFATYAIPIGIGLVAAIKVKAAAALTRGGRIGESMHHALIIGALIGASPFIWEYALADIVGPYLPF
ncbi:MAG: hypothetical protein ACMXYF_05750 [Candidatus Woesearchaeota archaeon]